MVTRTAYSAVIGLALLLQGCAGVIPAQAAPVAADVEAPRAAGSFEVKKGRPGVVIGAPHGTSDSATDLIGRELARLTGFGLVVATGFSRLDPDGRRFNINRPTESIPGSPARLEEQTAEARRLYEAYRRRVVEAAQGPLRLYIEVHGNGHEESSGRVEIATVGLSRDEAWRLKTLFELIRDARLQDLEAPRLQVWLESLDPLRYTASAAKQSGILSASGRALHIELPRIARTSYREVYTGLLGDFLTQSASFLVPRD
ncbi:MAG TPA: hypothetical protein VGT40_17225 [Methylomirabilota bacterium]|jgi:hypothetical protein|nr:hypothetical protein [Methylomirabilota bacterium]